jgi:hypothetical protein
VRPILKPALRRLWRGGTSLQLGADPLFAVVLDGVDDVAGSVLTLLDGTRDVDEVVAAAVGAGLDEATTRDLLGLLERVNALDDAATTPPRLGDADRERLGPDLASMTLLTSRPGAAARLLDVRRGASVLVVGAGRVGSLVAALLAAAGVGHVAVRDERRATRADAVPGGLDPAADGQPRAIAAVEAAQRAGAASVEGAVRPPHETDCGNADLAVVACDGWLVPDATVLDLFAGTELPYVVAGIREAYGVVGPLVVPGRTSCPRCHDLHRAERDPAWPAIAAQLGAGSRGAEAACDVTLAAGVAALAAGQVLLYLTAPDLPRCVDATLELRLPEWVIRRRTWQPHPDCSCAAAASAEADAVAGRVAAVQAALAERRTAGSAESVGALG